MSLSGTLQGYDGEFYRVMTDYGPLTVDGQGVICAGPGLPRPDRALCGDPRGGRGRCRDTAAARAVRGLCRGARLLVVKRQATDAGFALYADRCSRRASRGAVQLSCRWPPEAAATALREGVAELDLSRPARARTGRAGAGAGGAGGRRGARTIRCPRIATGDLARALSGEVTNWSEIGGPDMPLVLHALVPETGLQPGAGGAAGADAGCRRRNIRRWPGSGCSGGARPLGAGGDGGLGHRARRGR